MFCLGRPGEGLDFLREFEPDFFFDDQTGDRDTAAKVGPTRAMW